MALQVTKLLAAEWSELTEQGRAPYEEAAAAAKAEFAAAQTGQPQASKQRRSSNGKLPKQAAKAGAGRNKSARRGKVAKA